MFGTLRTFALCALVAFPVASLAQDQSQDQTEESETPAADGNDPSLTGLSMGASDGELQSAPPMVPIPASFTSF